MRGLDGWTRPVRAARGTTTLAGCQEEQVRWAGRGDSNLRGFEQWATALWQASMQKGAEQVERCAACRRCGEEHFQRLWTLAEASGNGELHRQAIYFAVKEDSAIICGKLCRKL